ncbi:MAG: hypothetical protein V2A54_05295 [Bacteroidota bacterium]
MKQIFTLFLFFISAFAFSQTTLVIDPDDNRFCGGIFSERVICDKALTDGDYLIYLDSLKQNLLFKGHITNGMPTGVYNAEIDSISPKTGETIIKGYLNYNVVSGKPDGLCQIKEENVHLNFYFTKGKLEKVNWVNPLLQVPRSIFTDTNVIYKKVDFADTLNFNFQSGKLIRIEYTNPDKSKSLALPGDMNQVFDNPGKELIPADKPVYTKDSIKLKYVKKYKYIDSENPKSNNGIYLYYDASGIFCSIHIRTTWCENPDSYNNESFEISLAEIEFDKNLNLTNIRSHHRFDLIALPDKNGEVHDWIVMSIDDFEFHAEGTIK